MKLLRYNQTPVEISADKLIGVYPCEHLIEVHYYDENDNEQVVKGYHLINRWK